MILTINENAEPILREGNDYSSLLTKIGDSRFVLIGEETHGTHEFYQARIEISKQLIEKKGFMAIAIEGDWPDAYSVHRYLHGIGDSKEVSQALDKFKRFPTWMWRNTTLIPFLQWLRNHNDSLSSTTVTMKKKAHKVGFYGLDLYSLYASMNAVIQYLSKIDPDAAQKARTRYACFDLRNSDPQKYAYLTFLGEKKSCIKEVLDQLLEMQHHAYEYVRLDRVSGEDEYFYAIQNAKLVKNAEQYYRSMFEGHVISWNIRDQHMAETLNVLADHLENRFNKPAKIIVWAHNSHIGDARATESSELGEINLGQLVRETHEGSSYLIGFSTYIGTVTAASDWSEPPECKQINPALEASYEYLFHQVKYNQFLLNLRANTRLEKYLKIPHLQRAIGVIYRPESERESHYFITKLPYQFDSIIHFDETSAVKPLDNV